MACTIDHLCMDLVVRVLESFTDARGKPVEAGRIARILALRSDLAHMQAELDWEAVGGEQETLLFDLKLRDGPGIGRMRQYFEALEADEAAQHFPPPPRVVSYTQFTEPEPAPSPVATQPANVDVVADIERVSALAYHHRFDEAKAHLLALLALTSEYDGIHLQATECLCGQALKQVSNPDREVYEWMKDRCLTLWHAWAAGATSGGEGTYRSTFIRKARADFAEAEKAAQFLNASSNTGKLPPG